MVAGDGGRHRRARHRPRVQGGRDRDVYRPRGASPLRERRGDGRELQRTARSGARPAGRGRRARLHRPVTVAGWLARRSGSATPRGAFIDPLADKVLVVGTLVALAAVGNGWPVTVVAVFVGVRECAVAVARTRG